MSQSPQVIRGGVSAVVAVCVFAVSFGPAAAHPAIDRQIADLSARIAETPAQATLYVRRGELHRIHRDWTLAEADYRKAQTLNPELLDVPLGLGLLQLDAGKPSAALASLNAFLVERPSHSSALAARARAKVQLEQFSSAADDYTRALAHLGDGPGQPGYYLERARAQVAASGDNLESAVVGLDAGLIKLGQPVTLQLLAIDYELELGQTDRALKRLETIASQSSRKETWLLRRAEILEKAGRVEEARQSYGDTLDAIGALRPGRRSNRAVRRLEAAATEALARLSPKQGDGAVN